MAPGFLLSHVRAPRRRQFELLGITDTSMLRPQVFALYENSSPEIDPVQIGLIASERQAINACLRSLAAEDQRFQPYADRYWAARGGSHTDGGAFRFSVDRSQPQPAAGTAWTAPINLAQPIHLPGGQHQCAAASGRRPGAAGLLPGAGRAGAARL